MQSILRAISATIFLCAMSANLLGADNDDEKSEMEKTLAVLAENYGTKLYLAKAGDNSISVRFDGITNHLRIDTNEKSHQDHKTFFPYVMNPKELDEESIEVQQHWKDKGVPEGEISNFLLLTISKTSSTSILQAGFDTVWDDPFSPLNNADNLSVLISKKVAGKKVAEQFILHVDGYDEPINFKRHRTKISKLKKSMSSFLH